MCDSVNHTRLPKEDLLPGWARQGKQGTKGDHVEHVPQNVGHQLHFYLTDHQRLRCRHGEGSNHIKG